MSQKVVLITGAARGIGRALARRFSETHRVAVTWHVTPPDETCADCPDALALQADLHDPEQVAGLPQKVIAAFGQIDVIVNNAGMVTGDDLEDFDAARAAQAYALNVTAPMGLTAAALPRLDRGACIVNITSTNARLPALGAHSYSGSKAALETWTRIAAKQLGPKGIRVNAVAPGAVNIPEAPRPEALTKAFTDMTALGALATPEDIADAVHFLASDKARAITGTILDVNGGYRL